MPDTRLSAVSPMPSPLQDSGRSDCRSTGSSCLDPDVRPYRVRDEALVMRLVVDRGDVAARRHAFAAPCDSRAQVDPRHRHPAARVALEKAFGLVDVIVDREATL